MGLTAELAHFVTETEVGQIPLEALEGARDALIDSIGVAVAGTGDEVSQIALKSAGAGVQQAIVWGTSVRTSCADAAFVNGVSGHALDYDDSLPSLRGHPSVPLCAAGLAVAEERRVSGRDFLAAFVVALEVAGKLGRALGHGHYRRGWHITATVGAFCSAAIAGRLMGLDARALRHAFGLAAAQSGGLVRNFGSMAKPFQAGHAARAGYTAAKLAAGGMTADPDIFDGPGGLIDVYGDDHSTTEMPSLGDPWEILSPGLYVKRWPCCYANHRGLAGVFELARNYGVTVENVEEIAVGFLPDADKALVHFSPTTGLEAKFSIEYCAAAAILDGRIGPDSFTEEAVRRPTVQALMKKVRRFPMPGEGSFSGVFGYTDVEIRAGGKTHRMRVERTPGSPEAPMTPADRLEKFIGCTSPVLGERGARALLDALEGAAQANDIGALVKLATPAERGAA